MEEAPHAIEGHPALWMADGNGMTSIWYEPLLGRDIVLTRRDVEILRERLDDVLNANPLETEGF